MLSIFQRHTDSNLVHSRLYDEQTFYAEFMKDVTAAGGTVLGGQFKSGEPEGIPGIGLYSSFVDTEGNRVSLLQAKS